MVPKAEEERAARVEQVVQAMGERKVFQPHRVPMGLERINGTCELRVLVHPGACQRRLAVNLTLTAPATHGCLLRTVEYQKLGCGKLTYTMQVGVSRWGLQIGMGMVIGPRSDAAV